MDVALHGTGLIIVDKAFNGKTLPPDARHRQKANRNARSVN